MLAVATGFAGREKPVSNNDGALPQLCPVLNKITQHSKASIAHSTGQPLVLGHTSNVQVLDGDDFEVFGQVITDFVQDGFALVADPVMKFGNRQLGFRSTVAAFHFPAECRCLRAKRFRECFNFWLAAKV